MTNFVAIGCIHYTSIAMNIICSNALYHRYGTHETRHYAEHDDNYVFNLGHRADVLPARLQVEKTG